MEDKKEAFLSNSLDRLKTSLEVEGSGRGVLVCMRGGGVYAWESCPVVWQNENYICDFWCHTKRSDVFPRQRILRRILVKS